MEADPPAHRPVGMQAEHLGLAMPQPKLPITDSSPDAALNCTTSVHVGPAISNLQMLQSFEAKLMFLWEELLPTYTGAHPSASGLRAPPLTYFPLLGHFLLSPEETGGFYAPTPPAVQELGQLLGQGSTHLGLPALDFSRVGFAKRVFYATELSLYIKS